MASLLAHQRHLAARSAARNERLVAPLAAPVAPCVQHVAVAPRSSSARAPCKVAPLRPSVSTRAATLDAPRKYQAPGKDVSQVALEGRSRNRSTVAVSLAFCAIIARSRICRICSSHQGKRSCVRPGDPTECAKVSKRDTLSPPKFKRCALSHTIHYAHLRIGERRLQVRWLFRA